MASSEFKATRIYAKRYMQGRRASMRGTDLGEAEVRFINRNILVDRVAEWDAWEDGWLDEAAGREMWHLRDCEDHDNCP
jgi:hypothetical protein